jgi:CubicO group peptidase (beta-lactamase class C family)
VTAAGAEVLNQLLLEQLCGVIQEEIHEGLQGAELAIGIDGAVVFSQGFGAARPETPIVLMSPSKTVHDSGLWLLIGDGLVDLEKPVAEYLPDFGTHGKQVVTVRQS